MGFSHVVMMLSLLSATAWPAHAASAPAKASLSGVTRRLARHQAEVQHLQQDVARQEADSARASERLQQQDKTIADLQRQLQALQTGSGAGHS